MPAAQHAGSRAQPQQGGVSGKEQQMVSETTASMGANPNQNQEQSVSTSPPQSFQGNFNLRDKTVDSVQTAEERKGCRKGDYSEPM